MFSLTHTLLPNEWRIAYGVTPIVHGFPISLSQQVFWNLDGLDASKGLNIANSHELHLPYGGMRLETDKDNIPTGNILGNPRNSTYDFWSQPGKISALLDDTFLINRRGGWEMDTFPVASLASKNSGVKVDLYTEQEALHVVSWNDDTGMKIPRTCTGTEWEHK